MKMLEYRESSRLRSPSYLIYRETHDPEKTAGNNETAGGMRGKDNIKPDGMDWATKSHQHRHHQGLPPVGETVPSRRHNQTDSESGKEVTRLTPKRCRFRLLFFVSILLVGVAQW